MSHLTGNILTPEEVGIDEVRLDELRDTFSSPGEFDFADPIPEDPAVPTLTRLDSTLQELSIELRQTVDPLSPQIPAHLQLLYEIENDSHTLLLKDYIRLVHVSTDAISNMLPLLSEYCSYGYHTFHGMCKIAATAYAFHSATIVRDTITSISSVGTDFERMSKLMADQQSYYEKSLEHLSVSWNSLTTSMSQYTAEIDRKILDLSSIASVRRPASTAPSTEYSHKPESLLGEVLRLTSGSSFKSDFGIVTVSPLDNVSFAATSSLGKPLATVTTAVKGMSERVLEKILNRDLKAVSLFVSANTSAFGNYHTWTPLQRKNFLDELFRDSEVKYNQWAEIPYSG